MPKRSGNRHTAKSSIYSPSVASDFTDLPTPIISSPPLPADILTPDILTLDVDPEPEVERHSPIQELEPGELDHDGAEEHHSTGGVLEQEETPDRPLSPLLFQESHHVLSFLPDSVTAEQTGHTRSPVLARYVTTLFFCFFSCRLLACTHTDSFTPLGERIRCVDVN